MYLSGGGGVFLPSNLASFLSILLDFGARKMRGWVSFTSLTNC